MLQEALKNRDFSEDASILTRAAAIVRKDIFSHQGFEFSGCFPAECQEYSLPHVSMILNGPNLKDQDNRDSQACLTIGQTIVYNIKKKPSCIDVKTRHNLERDHYPSTLVSTCMHSAEARNLSSSYTRWASAFLTKGLWRSRTGSTCERFVDDGVVSPACLRKGLFTVGALDNLDHNPSSTTSVTSFHGTGISLLQMPTKTEPGVSRLPVAIPPSGNEKHYLPHSYASVPAVALKTAAVMVPECGVSPVHSCLDAARAQEHKWVQHALSVLETELTAEDAIAWAAYHASMQPAVEDPPAQCALLPLFYEKSTTPAMIKHGMDVVRRAVEFLNPGQIPVTTFDQPLFAIAKFVQWKWPDTHGERVHVVMLGGLHTEIALWNTLGDVLQGSGWITALTEAGVASSGTANSFLNAVEPGMPTKSLS